MCYLCFVAHLISVMSLPPAKNILFYLRRLNKTFRLISILFLFSGLPLFGQEAIDFLLSDLPLTCLKEGKVLITFPFLETVEAPVYRLTGCLVDLLSREPLPYSNLLINGHGLVADRGGDFS